MFLTSQLRAGPGPDNDFWFKPIEGPTVSGARVTADTALKFSTIYKCVRAYHDAVGTMPMHVQRRVNDRKREMVSDHPVARLFSLRPNQWQTPAQFRGMLEAHVQLRGRAYAEVITDPRTMDPTDLIPLHPDRVTTEVTLAGTPRWSVRPPNGQPGAPRILLPGEMLHLTSMSTDGYEGLSPIALEAEAIGGAIAARDYGSRFWNNDAKPHFWIEVPGKFKDDDDKARFREGWGAAYGGANKHRPAVMDRGMKIHELGVDHVALQWLESRNFSDLDLCGIWRVPPHKIGLLSDAKYANIEMQNIEWVTDSLLPRMVMWEQVCRRDLLSGDDESLYFKMVPELLLRGDIKTRYEAYSKSIVDGWRTRNEIRELEDLDPLEGLDKPLEPMNMKQAGQALPSRTPDRAARAQAILHAAAERVARREAALVQRVATGQQDASDGFREHSRFVAQALGLPTEVAAGYCSHVQQQIEAMRADGSLSTITGDQWVAQQTADLMRLGD